MTVRDPVCGMEFAREDAAATLEHEGGSYYFCHPGCMELFVRHPEAFTGASHDVATARSGDGAAVEYTCPMHPEIVHSGPGTCPICGMALEPRTITVEAEPNPELAGMTRRFWVSLALTVPVV